VLERRKKGESWKDFFERESEGDRERERPTVFWREKDVRPKERSSRVFPKKRVKRKGPKLETIRKKKQGRY
jgi:hypothetical protein